jgi:hypothetical protein
MNVTFPQSAANTARMIVTLRDTWRRFLSAAWRYSCQRSSAPITSRSSALRTRWAQEAIELPGAPRVSKDPVTALPVAPTTDQRRRARGRRRAVYHLIVHPSGSLSKFHDDRDNLRAHAHPFY